MKTAWETTDIRQGKMLAVGTSGTPKGLVAVDLNEKNIRSYWQQKVRILSIINIICLIFFLTIISGA